MTTWTVLVNPAAGRRPVAAARVEEALARHGVAAEVVVVDGAPAMRVAILEVAAGMPRRGLAVVGGDGTVGLAVNVLLERTWDDPPVLGVLPGGTGCDLLRMFGIPQDLDAAARHLLGGEGYLMDVGRLSGEFGTRLFANVAQAGVGAAAAESAMRLPRGLGPVRYPAAFAARLPRFPLCEVEVVSERRGYRGPALAAIFANAQFFAGGWNVAPKATVVDGLLDIQVFNAKKLQAPALVPKIVRGVHLSNPAVRRMSLAACELRTEVPWPVEADGDYVGRTPVRVDVMASALVLKI